MKRIILGLVVISSLALADTKKGDTIESTGTYGCATQQEAIGIYDLVNDKELGGTGSMAVAVKAKVISNLLNSKYRSCNKIISGLDLKVQKVENWGPPENRFKYGLF